MTRHPHCRLACCLALLLSALAGSSQAAVAESTPAPSATPEAQAIEQAVARHALFAMLVEDRPDFRREWEKRLRLRQLLDGAGANDPDSSLHSGLGLAMEAAKSYLMRASDAASNRFLASLGKVIAEGEKDPEVCLAYVEPGGSDPRSTRRREMVESRLGALLVGDMLQALTEVVSSGRNGEKRILTRQELPTAIQPVILAMVEKHGLEALQGLGKVNDRRAEPVQRCQAMARMLAAFDEQPAARRAMLARTLFSGALPRVE